MVSTVEWMSLHVDALFVHNQAGQLVSINDPDQEASPRVYLGRTVEGNFWRFRHDLSLDLVSELESILVDEPVTTDFERPALTGQRLAAVLEQDAPIERTWDGPAWRFPGKITCPEYVQLQQVTADMQITDNRFTWLDTELEFWQPAFVIQDKGRIISLCHSSRNTPAAAEAGVETLEGHRDRGYATAVVAAWAQAVRDQDREPLYSTAWDNHASRALARKLGLILIGADLHLT